jgi:Mannosyl-glycoprotein endo-beta-N-acetylglucosaminidase
MFLSSGTLNTQGWAGSRWRAAVAALDTYAEFEGRNVDDIAASVVAHWALETNWGAAEYNYNLGGIHAAPGVAYFNSFDAGVPTRFQAWTSLDAGVRGYLDLVRNHFGACWSMLIADPPLPWAQWYDCLGAHGYYAVRGPYEAARLRVVQLVGD